MRLMQVLFEHRWRPSENEADAQRCVLAAGAHVKMRLMPAGV